MVVVANKQLFNVTPPSAGELWVTLAGRAADIRIGDEARVSLAADASPVRASVVNLYRRDEAEQSGRLKTAAKSSAKDGDESSAGDRSKTASRKSPKKSKADGETKSDSKPGSQSAAEKQFKLGINMLANGNREKAVEYFDKARQADPSDEMVQRIDDALAGKSSKPSGSKDDQ